MSHEVKDIYNLAYNLDKSLINKMFSVSILLGKLNGEAKTIPNSYILLQALPLQEAKESSEIENIFTTTHELYQPEELIKNPATKEVKDYYEAIEKGQQLLKQNGFISTNMIIEIQKVLCNNDAGLRKTLGTHIKKDEQVIYTPPQNYQDIVNLMSELEKYMNDDSTEIPLIKMALAHYQFEKIHPFYDGNGRTGRILNILMLIKHDILETPILYLSRYIIKNKERYYDLLQNIHEKENFNEWIEFFIDGIESTAKSAIQLIKDIKLLMEHSIVEVKKTKIKRARDFVDFIFINPFVSRKDLLSHLDISYSTLEKYLPSLTSSKIFEEVRIGNPYYYVNHRLLNLLSRD